MSDRSCLCPVILGTSSQASQIQFLLQTSSTPQHLRKGGIAPNEFIALKGTGLGPSAGTSSSMTTLLEGTKVYVNGTAAPLVYAQAGQINALVPFGVAGTGNATIQAEFNGVKGNVVTVPVVSSSPGIFTHEFGPGQAWLVNADGTFNSASNPATRNSYVSFWITGQGLVDPSLVDGIQPVGPPFQSPSCQWVCASAT